MQQIGGNIVNEPVTVPVDRGERLDTSAVRNRHILINVLRVLLLVIIIGGWELATRVGIIDSFFWGQPSGIWAQIVTWVTKGTALGPLWEQIAVTLEETVLGFIIGVVLGVISGVVLGRNRFLADVLGPYIKAGNSIPRVVLGSIFLIGLGLGIQSKVALAVVLVFFIVFFNAFQGVREADRSLLANARILGASQLQVTTQVILPSALTWIIASLHTSFSFALVGAVVSARRLRTVHQQASVYQLHWILSCLWQNRFLLFLPELTVSWRLLARSEKLGVTRLFSY